MEIFKITDLSFSYPLQEKLALNNINLDIEQGQFITLCGKSGCGKSTLLRHLKTILTPYGDRKGKIIFKNKLLDDVDKRTQSSKIGYVLQNPNNQIVTDKVWHELAFGLESIGCSNNVIRRRVAEMASFFGIQSWFMRNVDELSGGQKQLLNLASIMAMQPEVLILDEPTSQLDPIAANDFLETLKKINQDIGTTIILSEHRLEEVFPMSDRVIVMDKSRVIADGRPETVGRNLKNLNHDMFLAMPSSVRICAAVEKITQTCKTENYPLTVKEGRVWIDNLFKNIDIKCKKIIHQESDNNSPPVIEMKDVWFKFERHGEDIIKDLQLVVKKGEFHAVVGGNGTGKSTALSLISGINKPYRGKILINGKDIRKYSDKELFKSNLGVLPQNPQSLFVMMTVEKDLYEMLSYSKMSDEEKKSEVERIVDLMEIQDILHMHPYDLSGGEQQKAALAKLLLLKPKIILLDEPTKALDSHFKNKLANIFKKLRSQGVTILMVSHDIEFCARYADNCSLFFNGNIVTSGKANEFFSGNSFYTTFSNRMTRHIFEDGVTVEDVIELCRQNLITAANI